MKDDEIKLIQVKGLNFNFTPSLEVGYIVFCKTRGGNLRFFHWLFTTYVVEFLEISRKLAERDNEFCYLVIDGEAIQSKIFENSDVLKVFEDHKIHVGKGPASCSGVIGNALDCGNLFKGIKSKVSNSIGIDLFQTELVERIFNSLEINFSKEKKMKISNGISFLLGKEKECIKPQTIINSFRMIGMIPSENFLNSSPLFTPPSPFEMTLSRCPKHGDLTSAEVKKIIENLGEMAKIFGENGQITEENMDNLGITKGENGGQNSRIPNDLRVQHQQRAILLTAAASLERRRLWIQQRIDKREGIVKLREEKKENRLKREREKSEAKEIRMAERAAKRAKKEEKRRESRGRRENKLRGGDSMGEEGRKTSGNIPPGDFPRRSGRLMHSPPNGEDGNPRRKSRKRERAEGKGEKRGRPRDRGNG